MCSGGQHGEPPFRPPRLSRQITALGAASLPGIAPLIGRRSADSLMSWRSDPPPNRTTIPRRSSRSRSREVDVRRTPAGRTLMARIYQPTRRGTVPDRARPARRRVERQGSPRRRADGSRAGRERHPGRRHRPDAGAGSAVSGVRAGRQLRRALAEIEGRGVERRPVENRRVRQLQRRTRRRAARDAPARSALQRDSAARRAERRRDDRLRRDALADQRPVRALPARGDR